ncbi:hypothetical protein AVEN_52318-1, partial [Araneus ventricosus]
SESSLHFISSLKTNSPLAQDIQSILLNSPSIKLGWIKEHVEHAGNESVDLLVKKATSSFQRSRFPQLLGKNLKSSLQRDMAHTQLTLRDLASERPIAVVVASWEALCT